ncbi:MAG: hypothetical protein AAB383_06180 [Patescibacteria group bacterium]
MKLTPTRYSLEILPAVQDAHAKHREGACVQECSHCPFSAKHASKKESVYISEEVQTALLMTVQHLALSGQGEHFGRLLIPAHYQKPGQTPFMEGGLRLFEPPSQVALPLGDLKTGTDPKSYEGLIDEFDRLVPLQYFFGNKPYAVSVGYRVPLLRDLGYTQESFDEAVNLGRGALRAVQNSRNPLVNRRYLGLAESVNAHPRSRAGEISDQRNIKEKINELVYLLDQILGDTLNKSATLQVRKGVIEGALHVEVVSQSSDFHLSYKLRVIPQGESKEMPLEENHVLPIAFMPGYVWVNHHTHFGKDESLHFSYQEYIEIFEQASLERATLRDVLFRRIRARRLQAD